MASWTDAAPRDELARCQLLEAEAGSAAILPHDIAGTAYAAAPVCPHYAA